MTLTLNPTPETANRINVPKLLSEEQVRFFVENGYLIVPDLMGADEVEELRADTVNIARGRYPCENIQPADAALTDAAVLQNILCIHMPHYVSPVMEKYVRHEKISDILSQIVAAHLPKWDGSVKCTQSMLFVKPPTFQGQSGPSVAPGRDLHFHPRSLPVRRLDSP